MDDSWKVGLITAEEMRNANVFTQECIDLVKDILEAAKKENEQNLKSLVYLIGDSKKFNLLPKVVTMLCSLGYDSSMTQSKMSDWRDDGDYSMSLIHISW